MEEVKRLCVKWCGLKETIMKLTEKVQEALTTELETVNIESIPESQKILVSTTTEQLKEKLQQIIELDGRISKIIQEEEELETEICDADTYQSNKEQNIAPLMEIIKKAGQSPVAQSETLPPSVTDKAQHT